MSPKLFLTLAALAAVPVGLYASTQLMPSAQANPAETAASETVAPKIGAAAPEFSGVDILSGHDVDLAGLKGKIVVLEWSNHQCPFVRKHYDSQNMQKLQKELAGDDLAWITIVSSAEGKEGFVNAEEGKKIVEDEGAAPTYKLLDPTGEIGHKYGASATPHMFVIDKDGNLAYQGAIDDNPSPRESAVEGAHNYVRAAVEALRDGKAVETNTTQPYGCGVKY
ncbi:MAG: redoxin family protein [Pseudobdellovibrionaceae bacterium]